MKPMIETLKIGFSLPLHSFKFLLRQPVYDCYRAIHGKGSSSNGKQ